MEEIFGTEQCVSKPNHLTSPKTSLICIFITFGKKSSTSGFDKLSIVIDYISKALDDVFCTLKKINIKPQNKIFTRYLYSQKLESRPVLKET